MGGWDLDAPETPAQRRASENGVRLVRRALEMIDAAIAAPPLRLTVETICELHHLAMEGLIDRAGAVRTDDVKIRGSRHQPPPWTEVGRLLDEMCTYSNTSIRDATHRAAFVMWRLNWIHPFAPDGNGRTARALAMIVLHAQLGVVPGAAEGKPTFLEWLSWKRLDYNDALEAADRACMMGAVDVSALETLIEQAVNATG